MYRIVLEPADAEDYVITIEYKQPNLVPLKGDFGTAYKDFVLTVTAEVGKSAVDFLSESVDLKVRIVNPCDESSGLGESVRPQWCPVPEEPEIEVVVIEPEPIEPSYYKDNIPDWMASLEDILIIIGDDETAEYNLGPRVNQFGLEIQATVDLGNATAFAIYLDESNSILVDSRAITEESLGYYKVLVTANETYYNQTFFYQKYIYLRV